MAALVFVTFEGKVIIEFHNDSARWIRIAVLLYMGVRRKRTGKALKLLRSNEYSGPIIKNLIPISVLLLVSTSLGAQQFTRTELGLESSILRGDRLLKATDSGVGIRFTYNLTPSIGLDSEFNSYLTNLTEITTQDGGRASVFLAGAKAGIRRSKFGAFFKARPGIISFSNVPTRNAIITGGAERTRKTHAALDLGLAGEFYPSARTIVRLDVGQMLIRYGEIPEAIGLIGGPLHVETGVSYRLGKIETGHEASFNPKRFSAGVQYSLFTSERGLDTVRDESGIGGWFTWNFSKYVSLDSSATYFPRLIHIADLQQGGRTFQAVAGFRGGIRREHFGVFGKLRPGIQGYTETVGNAITFADSPFVDFALDAGGIIEVYTSPKTMLRFDAGDINIYYRSRDVLTQTGLFHAPSFTNSTIQLTAGFGWRF
jgi:hypothetical protein